MPGFTVLSLPRVRLTEAALPLTELDETVFFFTTAFAFDFGAGLLVRGADFAGRAALGTGFFAAGFAFTGADFFKAGLLAALTGVDFALLGIAGCWWSRGSRRWSSE